jgi:mono/diheme cytochrome c family protein
VESNHLNASLVWEIDRLQRPSPIGRGIAEMSGLEAAGCSRLVCKGLIMHLIGLMGLVAFIAAIGSATAQTPLERGDYLVNAVMACDGCHTPRGPGGFVMEKRFSGGSQTWDTPKYTVKGSNITPDPTGIGAWSADDLKRALTEGVRPTGVLLAPQMPFAFYKVLTPGDLDAVAAYVRSVTPVRNEVQLPVYKAAAHAELVPNAEKPMSEETLGDPVKRGFYLATIAHCMECHSRRPDGTQDYTNWLGKGGYEFKDTWGTARVPNITSHPQSGIGAWSDAEVKRALTQGVGRDGRAFKQPMARQAYFSKMTAADIDAIVAWLRTLPPIE